MKKRKIIYLILLLIILCSTIFIFYITNSNYDKGRNDKSNQIAEKKISLEEIKTYYSDYVKLVDGSILYIKEGEKYREFSTVGGEIEVSLDSNYEVIDEYFKILNSDYYIKYDSFYKIDNLSNLKNEYKSYKNYIVYNENINLNDKSKLFVDQVNYYEVSGGSYPIIIKDSDKYGIEFNNSLVYVNKIDVKEVVNSDNSIEEVSDGVSVLNYHFVVSGTNENNELSECKQNICITDTMFENHIKYLKDNNYYGVSMRDLELFIDGKIRLPKNSVSITIDDGWYVARSIRILEKYQVLGTLFLIGSLASPSDYRSEYLEIHSHTWNMHGLNNGDDCPNNSGRGGILCFSDEVILDDLKKSRDSLDNTPYFCYPFYDYNDRAINLLKQAGFSMAFAGQTGNKARVGTDKYKVPRYVIYGSTSMNTFINYVS